MTFADIVDNKYFINLFERDDLTSLGFSLEDVSNDLIYPDKYTTKLVLHYCIKGDVWFVFGIDKPDHDDPDYDGLKEFNTEQEALDYMLPLLDDRLYDFDYSKFLRKWLDKHLASLRSRK